MLYKLYLDETGTPNPTRGPYFLMSGIIIKDEASHKIKEWADRIKFKYWSDDFRGIVFHSREIGLRMNRFNILRDPDVEKDFFDDLYKFLDGSGIKCIIAAAKKTDALKLGWDIEEIYSRSADEIIRLFIEYLYNKKGHGQIIIESAGTQKDIVFYKKYIHYLANGMQALNIEHQQMKRMLTAISFVSKNNYDIETQVADLLAYPALCQYLAKDGTKKIISNSYEERMIQILQNKLITIGTRTSLITIPGQDTPIPATLPMSE